MTAALAPRRSAPALPEILGGRYRLLKELGNGAMGTVYLVEHQHTGQRRAVKVLRGAGSGNAVARERFRREALALGRLSSDHVVQVVDAELLGDSPGPLFLVMELLDGLDLSKLLKAGPLGAVETVWMLRHVARGLDLAHQAGLVHRDLKPANLFLHRLPNGTLVVKLVDFGIAKRTALLPTEATNVELTTSGVLVGTPDYMAPEQLRGRMIGPATDRWALGMVTFRLLTARTYWGKLPVGVLVPQIVAGPVEPPSRRAPGLGAAFDDWFRRSCAVDPKQRWSSAAEQIDALAVALRVSPPERVPEALLQRLAIAEQPAGIEAAQSARRAPHRRTIAVLGAALAALAVVALGVSMVHDSPLAHGLAGPRRLLDTPALVKAHTGFDGASLAGPRHLLDTPVRPPPPPITPTPEPRRNTGASEPQRPRSSAPRRQSSAPDLTVFEPSEP